MHKITIYIRNKAKCQAISSSFYQNTSIFNIANIYCKLSFGSLSNECIKTGTARSRFFPLINIILDQKELKVNNKSTIFFVKTMNSKKRGLYTHILNAVLSNRT